MFHPLFNVSGRSCYSDAMNASSYMMLYGALVAVAGVIGAITSGSAISAVSGVIFGALAIAAGFGLRSRNMWARPLGFAVSGFLLLFFAMRIAQGQLFPALIVALLSLLALVVLARITPLALPSAAQKQAPDSSD